MYDASASKIRKMQAVLNAFARLITRYERFDHKYPRRNSDIYGFDYITPAITRILRDKLDWLPVLQRIRYKIAPLVL